MEQQMNTKTNINNTGIKYAISYYKLKHGLYLNPDLRREWTIARDDMAIVERINPVARMARNGSRFHAYAEQQLPGYLFMFKQITMMHNDDVYDALYEAAQRLHKAAN